MFSSSFVVYKFISVFCVLAGLNRVYGVPFQTDGNTVHVPTSNYKNGTLYNITNNELITGAIHPSTTVSVNSSTSPYNTGNSFGKDESTPDTSSNQTTTSTSFPRTTVSPATHQATNLSTHVQNHTTVAPSSKVVKHHFSMKILDYILIPVGCLIALALSYFLVRHVQKVRRKRRLERELLHQYSYPNSEADDMEEQNIGEIESIVNAQFVAYSDRADKNMYEDSAEVDLAFGESSKLVVHEPPSPPEDFEVSTSFNS